VRDKEAAQEGLVPVAATGKRRRRHVHDVARHLIVIFGRRQDADDE
jgi:hypothetical protein